MGAGNLWLVLSLCLYFLGIHAQDGSTDPYTCSASSPCSIGCCSNTGVCGLGPDYCGETCISTCDYKSECDPGWGATWSAAETCPLNVCCSKYGFCGTTSDFCGNKTVTKPSCSGTSTSGRTIGYYEGWSTTRACDQVPPDSLPAGIYSHLNYAFALIDPNTFEIAPMSELDTVLYPRFTALKDLNPGLETWISVGGWSMNDADQPTAATFSNLAASSSAQSSFITSLLSFMTTYGFDGVDIDWEYPVAPERSGQPADYKNYVSFLTNLKSALGSNGHNYGLSITLPSSYWYMQNFDIVNLAKIVDWFNVMTYDLHGTWDSTDKFIGPYINAHTNLTEIDLTMDLFWRNDIPPAKITMGLGFYGRSFTLTDPSCTVAGCPFSSGGTAGPCSASSGTLMDVEIQDVIAAGGVVTLDSAAAVKQVVWDTNQWVSYDDADTFALKIDYANGKCLGGTMVWAVSNDDGNWTASQALGSSTSLGLSEKLSIFGGPSPKVTDTISSCLWGNCGEPCSSINSGLSAATSGSGQNKGSVGIYSACPDGQTRPYCCPQNDVPTCTWRGRAPFCGSSGKCEPLEVEVASDISAGGAECWTSHKVLCCTKTQSDAQAGQCDWEGSAPFCAGIGGKASCSSSHPDRLTYSSFGAGGESYCATGYKSFCCTDPLPYTGCDWTSSYPIFSNCDKTCSAGKQTLAVDPTWCNGGGYNYFCCDQIITQTTTPATTPPLNFCVDTDDEYVESGKADDDNNPADLLELYWWEQTCFSIPNLADPTIPGAEDVQKRSGVNVQPVPKHWNYFLSNLTELAVTSEWEPYYFNTSGGRGSNRYPSVCLPEGQCYIAPELAYSPWREILEELQEYSPNLIQPRGPERTYGFCTPSGSKIKNFRSSPYPDVSILSNSKKFFSAVVEATTAGICAGLPLIEGVRQLGINYVAEHVTELQTPVQFASAMVNAIYPDGTTPSAAIAAYDWLLMFGPNGYFYQTWDQLGMTIPEGFTGATPALALYAIFGTTADTTNLLILDAKTNSLKAIMWRGFKNIVGVASWGKTGHEARAALLNRITGALPLYLNSDEAQNALRHTYTGFIALLQAMDKASRGGVSAMTPIVGTTFDAAYTEFTKTSMTFMETNLQEFATSKLTSEIAFWAGNPSNYDTAVCAAMKTDLSTSLANVLTNVVINQGFLQS